MSSHDLRRVPRNPWDDGPLVQCLRCGLRFDEGAVGLDDVRCVEGAYSEFLAVDAESPRYEPREGAYP